MRRAIRLIDTRVLPRGWKDLGRQIMVFVGLYLLYELVRGLVSLSGADGYKPFGDATKIINLERLLHVFIEPSVQAWASSVHWVMDVADWTYLNAHYFVTIAALAFIYLRRNDSFYFVRNMFMIAMAIALVGYAVYPTAPPRLMPEWGFTDSIAQFMGVPHVEDGPGKAWVLAFGTHEQALRCQAALAQLLPHEARAWLMLTLMLDGADRTDEQLAALPHHSYTSAKQVDAGRFIRGGESSRKKDQLVQSS